MGSWRFTLRVRAVRSFVSVAPACVAATLELRRAKLHWRKTTSALSALLNGNRHRDMTFRPTPFGVGNICNRRAYLLCNLHGRLQIDGLLRPNPRLDRRRQTVDKPKHGLSGIDIGALRVFLRELHDVVGHRAPLHTLRQCLTRLIRVVGWLEVIKQRNLQSRPAVYISLDTIPGIRRSIKQGYCHLALLDVVLQFN